jgi:hypothetical protein
VIFIDGKPYPYHLAISRNWMVHYFSADMLQEPWKLAEEQCFLARPLEVLGEAAWTAISDIGKRLLLDYAGIDFTLLEDRTILVFEANATMHIHPEAPDGPLAHKNVYVEAIIEAFGNMVVARAKSLAY